MRISPIYKNYTQDYNSTHLENQASLKAEEARAKMKDQENRKTNNHENMMQGEIGRNEYKLNKNVRWGGDVKEHINRKLFGLKNNRNLDNRPMMQSLYQIFL